MFTETMLMSTKLAKAFGLTILGMGVVFTVLFLISVALDVLRQIIAGFEKRKPLPLSTEQKSNIKIKRRTRHRKDKEELIAVITAAVADFTGKQSGDFKVRSIRPRYLSNSPWASAGRLQQMEQRQSIQSKRGK